VSLPRAGFKYRAALFPENLALWLAHHSVSFAIFAAIRHAPSRVSKPRLSTVARAYASEVFAVFKGGL
jgi:hypothetical protein